MTMEILTDLLRAETAHRHAASVRYRMSAAKLPAVKDLDAFVFDGKRHDPNLPRFDLRSQLAPVGCAEPGQPIDLLDQQHITGAAVVQQPEQLRPSKASAALMFNIARRDTEPMRSGERIQRRAGAGRVLFSGRCA